jgi:bacterioferritin (cytochrome b1)
MKSYLNKVKAQDEDYKLKNLEQEKPALEELPENDEGTNPIVGLLQAALLGEYRQWDLYTAYASRLKGEARNPIAEEFKTHAEEELEHIEILQRYLVSMGVVPTLNRKHIPELQEEASAKDIIELQLAFENEAVALYKKMLGILDAHDALTLDIEDFLIKEQEHVHDLELLLEQPAVVAGLMFRHEEPGEPTKPQAGYGKKIDCVPKCGCGGKGKGKDKHKGKRDGHGEGLHNCTCVPSFVDKINNHWCMFALNELSPDIYARWQQMQLMTEQEKAFVEKALALKFTFTDPRAISRFIESRC